MASATAFRSLSLYSIASYVSLLIGLYLIIGAIVNYRKLRHFKGPPLASVSRLWLFWQEVNGRTPQAQFKAIKKYGSPARIGPNLLVTDDADVLRHMAATESGWSRSEWYIAMKSDPRCDSVFSTRDEKMHAELKVKEAAGYNGRDITSLESDIDARILDMVKLIGTKYKSRSFDLAAMTRYFTLDVLGTVAIGKPFGFLAADADLYDYNKTNSSFMLFLNLVGNHSWVRWLYTRDWVQALGAPRPTDKSGIGPLLKIVNDSVAERFGADRKVKNDMLGSFVKNGLTQLQCEVEGFLQIIAGSDSTTTVLRSTLFLLLANPAAYAKLKAEIDAATSNIKNPDSVIENVEAQKLPYLAACIQEGMRLYPPLFGLKGKHAPPGGDTIKNLYYPEGTEVALCDDAMCQRAEIFGPDAHLFRPERWTNADEETRAKYRRVVESVFGAGRWKCLGRHIALVELHKAVAELIRRFDWAIADPMRGIDVSRHAIHIQRNMNVVATSRST